MPQKDRPANVQRPAPIPWVFAKVIPTHEWFKGQSFDEMGNLQEAVECFIYFLEKGEFLTWEAVVCEEQGLSLTAPQKAALSELVSFSDTADSERILYINEFPRPSEPWYAILNRIVPHLLMEPFVTAGEHWEVRTQGWPRLMQAVREYGEVLSLPPSANSIEEVVPADLRHKLWLQVCFDDLCGLGQGPELNLKEQPDRIDDFIQHLREHKESVRFFNLTLESMLQRLILPDADAALFVEMMQNKLSLGSVQEPLADHL